MVLSAEITISYKHFVKYARIRVFSDSYFPTILSWYEKMYSDIVYVVKYTCRKTNLWVQQRLLDTLTMVWLICRPCYLNRNSHRRCSIKKDVLKKFRKNSQDSIELSLFGMVNCFEIELEIHFTNSKLSF